MLKHSKSNAMKQRFQMVGQWLSGFAIRILIGLLQQLPYRIRLHMCGRMMSSVVAPLSGARRRIRENLRLVMPDLPKSEVERLVGKVPYNMGRSLMEIFSGPEFIERVCGLPLTGPGGAALEKAHREGRGVLLVTGHIGNYDAVRAALLARGYRVGGIYKRMANPYFNHIYVNAITKIGTPLFENDRSGMVSMVRFLRDGGMVGMVLDQRINDAEVLQFMGKPARTALSAAELALRHNAVVLPCYGIATADGSYEIVIESPIPHNRPEIMTQALNDSLEARVRATPEQWMWTHWRWKYAGNPQSPDP